MARTREWGMPASIGDHERLTRSDSAIFAPRASGTSALERAPGPSGDLVSDGTGALIPVLNEAQNLAHLIPRLEQVSDLDWMLFVADPSADGTEELLQAKAREHRRIHVFARSEGTGLGNALREGLAHALRTLPFDRIVQMDGDMSHDPMVIPRLLNVEADLVLGSRYLTESQVVRWPPGRRIISFGANAVSRFALRSPAHDLTTGFRVYSRRLAQAIVDQARCGGYEFQVEGVWIANGMGFSIQEVPITFRDRKWGTSKLSTPVEVLKLGRFVARAAAGRVRKP